LPGNGISRTRIKVIDLAGSLTLKGKALAERLSLKDAYDIFALTNYKGGPTPAAEYFKDTIAAKKLTPPKQRLLDESLANIAAEFKDANQRGPFNVESFSEYKYSREVVAAQVGQFLKNIR
jgi:hypothetical protein